MEISILAGGGGGRNLTSLPPPLLSQLIRHREEDRDRQALVRRIRRYIGSTDDEEIYSAILFHGHYSTVID